MSLIGQLETLLFVSAKPLAIKKIAKLLKVEPEQIKRAAKELQERYNNEASGLSLLDNNDSFQLVSNPQYSQLAEAVVKEEVSGELTRPSLETLTIIAYRGPITKPEIEQIRGINCSVILRNLLMRGLINERDDKTRLQPVYTVSNDFLRHLGLNSVDQLPDYKELSADQSITEILDGKIDETAATRQNEKKENEK